MGDFITPFEKISAAETDQYGGKGANLGELTRAGFRVPRGFCLKADVYNYFLEAGGLEPEIQVLAGRLDSDDFEQVDRIAGRIREPICAAGIPRDICREIIDYYFLISPVAKAAPVAIRSSNASPTTGMTSFPGMMDTFYYIKGEEAVMETVKRCWASLWNTRAVMDRRRRGVEHLAMRIAPVIQEMIDADSAGVAFTANPVSRSPDEMVVEANWGLGESVVSGRTATDHFLLDKAGLEVKKRFINKKTHMVVRDEGQGTGSKVVGVPADRSTLPVLDEDQLRELGTTALEIEAHYGAPQDIEWAFQGRDLYLLQTRRISTL